MHKAIVAAIAIPAAMDCATRRKNRGERYSWCSGSVSANSGLGSTRGKVIICRVRRHSIGTLKMVCAQLIQSMNHPALDVMLEVKPPSQYV